MMEHGENTSYHQVGKISIEIQYFTHNQKNYSNIYSSQAGFATGNCCPGWDD